MSIESDGALSPRSSRLALSSLITAHALSQTGNAITVLATPFFVISLGGSAVQVGLATTFAAIPVVAGGPLGAVFVDRIGHRNASILADISSGLALLLVALFQSTIGLPFWGFLVLIFLSGLLDTPGQTARNVLLPDLAHSARTSLPKAVGIASGAERAAVLLGAPLGGFLVSSIGAANAFYVIACLFGASMLLVWAFVPRDADELLSGADMGSVKHGYWKELGDGLRFVIHQPLLRLIVIFVFLTNLLDAARFSVLLPLYASEALGGATAMGLLAGGVGGGALVGSLLFSAFSEKLKRLPLFVVGFLIAGGPLSFAVAAHFTVVPLFAFAILTGLAAGAVNPIIGVLRLELVPKAMRGRVQSFMVAGSWAGIPLGALLAGASTEAWGLATSFLIVGVVYVGASLVPLTGKAWRQMDDRTAIANDPE